MRRSKLAFLALPAVLAALLLTPAPAHAVAPPDGVLFVIKDLDPQHAGQCLAGITQNNQVVSEDCTTVSANEQWTYNGASKQIKNALFGTCMTSVPSTFGGFIPQLQTCDPNSVAQDWNFTTNQEIQSASTFRCLDLPVATSGLVAEDVCSTTVNPEEEFEEVVG